MFTGAAPAPSWTSPAQHSQQPTWPGGWDQAALAQSFSTMGLTPPVSTKWIDDSGASFHTTPDAGILSRIKNSKRWGGAIGELVFWAASPPKGFRERELRSLGTETVFPINVWEGFAWSYSTSHPKSLLKQSLNINLVLGTRPFIRQREAINTSIVYQKNGSSVQTTSLTKKSEGTGNTSTLFFLLILKVG